MNDKKALLHAKRWGVYMNEKKNLIKGGYLVKFISYDINKFLWEVVDDHVIE